VNTAHDGCCFFKYGGTPARLFPALSVYARMMGEMRRFVGERRLGDDGYCVGFETEEQAVLVLWQAAGETTVRVPSGAACVDIVGRPIAGDRVALSGSVLYFTGASGTAGRMMEALG